ncbi:MAG: aminoacyl-tRNA hydrolase [Chlorobi bacterium]|nr:aminoacyl-tRNA hydrolase [Chlorobiota bacterium]
MKYLITGLGNIGDQYRNTRHNAGFQVLDRLADASGITFEDKRYGFVARMKYKSRWLVLLKPSTFVNLSGRAVNYWLKKEKIAPRKLLVIADDIALPFGKLRLRAHGGHGGHNGLENIITILGTPDFARLRIGIGNDFPQGRQVDYVLGKWSEEESEHLPEMLDRAGDIIKSFTTLGVERTMNIHN